MREIDNVIEFDEKHMDTYTLDVSQKQKRANKNVKGQALWLFISTKDPRTHENDGHEDFENMEMSKRDEKLPVSPNSLKFFSVPDSWPSKKSEYTTERHIEQITQEEKIQ